MDTAVAIRTLEATYKSSADAAAVEAMIARLTEKVEWFLLCMILYWSWIFSFLFSFFCCRYSFSIFFDMLLIYCPFTNKKNNYKFICFSSAILAPSYCYQNLLMDWMHEDLCNFITMLLKLSQFTYAPTGLANIINYQWISVSINWTWSHEYVSFCLYSLCLLSHLESYLLYWFREEKKPFNILFVIFFFSSTVCDRYINCRST